MPVRKKIRMIHVVTPHPRYQRLTELLLQQPNDSMPPYRFLVTLGKEVQRSQLRPLAIAHQIEGLIRHIARRSSHQQELIAHLEAYDVSDVSGAYALQKQLRLIGYVQRFNTTTVEFAEIAVEALSALHGLPTPPPLLYYEYGAPDFGPGKGLPKRHRVRPSIG